jgi:hypothetical protein
MPPRDYSTVKTELESNRDVTRTLRRIRKWNWICWPSLAFVLALSCWAMRHLISIPTKTYTASSLLGGPAGLAILTIVVGLSAYLRSVAGTADERIEKIRAGGDDLYPKITASKDGRTACTEKKLDSLEATFWKLQVVAGFLIVLTFVISVRLFVESLLNVSASSSIFVQFYVRLWDSLILVWLVLATLGLAIMHWVARNRDERLRTMAEACRTEHESASTT